MRKNITAILITAVMFIICVIIYSAINGTSFLSPEEKYGISFWESGIQPQDVPQSPEISIAVQDAGVTMDGAEEDTAVSTDHMANGAGDMTSSLISTSESQVDTENEDSFLENQEKLAYIERLNNIKETFQKNWDSLSESDMTSMKNLQQQEHDKWDEELNIIYNKIKKDLPEETFISIRDEERQWIKDRDEKAAVAASAYQGGSMESFIYTSTLTDVTIERTYELVDIYFDLK